jgi:hypothetical protein
LKKKRRKKEEKRESMLFLAGPVILFLSEAKETKLDLFQVASTGRQIRYAMQWNARFTRPTAVSASLGRNETGEHTRVQRPPEASSSQLEATRYCWGSLNTQLATFPPAAAKFFSKVAQPTGGRGTIPENCPTGTSCNRVAVLQQTGTIVV